MCVNQAEKYLNVICIFSVKKHNPYLRVDNTTYEIVVNTQVRSLDKAVGICSGRNNSDLLEFSSQLNHDRFVDEMLKVILPDLLEERDFWEFWTVMKSNVEVENAVSFEQLDSAGLHIFCLNYETS